MTMEVLAAEFPDIFQHFIEIVPDPNKPDQHIYVNEEDSNPSVSWKNGNIDVIVSSENVIFSSETETEQDTQTTSVFTSGATVAVRSPEGDRSPLTPSQSDIVEDSRRSHNIMMDHDYDGQNIVVKDSNRNMTKYFTPSPGTFVNTPSHGVIENPVQLSTSGGESIGRVSILRASVDEEVSVHLEKSHNDVTTSFADLDEILQDLSMISHDFNSNIQMLLDTEKSGFGCSWSSSKGSNCVHGQTCPFTTKILDLDQVPNSIFTDQVSKPPQRIHNVVVLKQTPHGLVKVPESMIPQHQLHKFRGLHNPRSQDISTAGPYNR